MANSALLQSLIDDVYALTNRPDLVAETAVAVRAATLKMHHVDFFYKDLFEISIDFQSNDYTHSFEFATTVPRWRAANYIRKVEAGMIPGNFLTLVVPSDILDNYGQSKSDIFYVAGMNLNIKSSTEIERVIVSCYRHPSILPETYASWIATENPFAIIYEATATIFKTIGYDEQHATYQKLVRDEIIALQAGNVTANAY